MLLTYLIALMISVGFMTLVFILLTPVHEKEMNDWLRKIRNKVETKEWWQTLKAKVRGHIQYYGISENYTRIEQFYKTISPVL